MNAISDGYRKSLIEISPNSLRQLKDKNYSFDISKAIIKEYLNQYSLEFISFNN
jgi:hypothetical protein